VRRCLVAMKRCKPSWQWCDVSGNLAFDLGSPRLGIETKPGWAAHNRPPYEVNLSLPMLLAVLFAGLPVAWCVENDTSKDGKGDLVPPGALDMVYYMYYIIYIRQKYALMPSPFNPFISN